MSIDREPILTPEQQEMIDAQFKGLRRDVTGQRGEGAAEKLIGDASDIVSSVPRVPGVIPLAMGSPRKDPSPDEVRRLYWVEQLSAKKTAGELRMSERTLLQRMDDYNISRRHGKLPEASMLQALMDLGVSAAEIAQEYGVTTSAVRGSALRRLGRRFHITEVPPDLVELAVRIYAEKGISVRRAATEAGIPASNETVRRELVRRGLIRSRGDTMRRRFETPKSSSPDPDQDPNAAPGATAPNDPDRDEGR